MRLVEKIGFKKGEIVKFAFERDGQERDIQVWSLARLDYKPV
jgi:hypothetical protein